jgi:glycerol uptake facilitator protein
MTLRAYLVELVGTFLLVFFSGGVICATQLAAHKAREARVDEARVLGKDVTAVESHKPIDTPVSLLCIALVQGAVLAIVLSVTTRVSQGCLNPAVTLTLWVTKRFDFGRCFTLIVVQMIGAVLAGMLIFLVFPQNINEASFVGTPHLYDFYKSAEDVRPGHWVIGSAVEILLTFLLTLTLLTTVLDAKRAEWRWAPLLCGLALTAAVLVGYHLSGAALNPARWWGTAVWQQQVPQLANQPVLQDHLPYWMGPIVGALLAGVVHAEWLRPEAEKKG